MSAEQRLSEVEATNARLTKQLRRLQYLVFMLMPLACLPWVLGATTLNNKIKVEELLIVDDAGKTRGRITASGIEMGVDEDNIGIQRNAFEVYVRPPSDSGDCFTASVTTRVDTVDWMGIEYTKYFRLSDTGLASELYAEDTDIHENRLPYFRLDADTRAAILTLGSSEGDFLNPKDGLRMWAGEGVDQASSQKAGLWEYEDSSAQNVQLLK